MCVTLVADRRGYTPTLVVTYGGLTSEDRLSRHRGLEALSPLAVRATNSSSTQICAACDVTGARFQSDDAAAAAKEPAELGVIVNTGAHGQREGLATHWEMWSFAEAA